MTNERTWLVYALSDSRAPDETRYIGITSQGLRRRMAQHRNDSRLNHRTSWIRSVFASGAEVVARVSHDGLSESAAKSTEVAMIAEGRDLVNATAGGDGNVGWIPTAETRARMSVSASKSMTPEHRNKLSAIQKGMVTDQTRAKIGATHRGKSISATMRASVSLAMTDIAKMRPPRNGGYKGVSRNRSRWQSSICVGGTPRYLGTFNTAEDAARAYDAAAISAWGDACYTNMPATTRNDMKEAA